MKQDVVKSRADIMALENTLREIGSTREENPDLVPTTHYFAPGVYAREIFMPADTVLTGAIHKTEHLNILSQGKVTVASGGESITLTAPHTFVSPVGTKRAIYSHEDSTWTTIHVTDLTDPDEIVEEITVDSFEELDEMMQGRK